MSPMRLRSINLPEPGTGQSEGMPLRLAPAPGDVPVGVEGFASPVEVPAWGELALRQPQGNRAHALLAYPVAHHEFWRTVRAQARVAARDEPLPPAAFDEHLGLEGIQESGLWMGDALRFADCELTVTFPRLPDARFNATLGFAQAAKMVAESRWGGFWLAVRTPGRLRAGEAFELLPGPRTTSLVELFRARTKGRTF